MTMRYLVIAVLLAGCAQNRAPVVDEGVAASQEDIARIMGADQIGMRQ